MSSSLRNKTVKIPSERPSQSKGATSSFQTWVLGHLGADTLQKAQMAIVAIESERDLLRSEVDAQRKLVKGLTAQNSQMSAQLLKLSSLLTRKGELRNTEENASRLEEYPRTEYEQTLLLVLQEIFKSSPATIQELLRIHSQEQRLLKLANIIKQEATRITTANNTLQAQVDTELNAPSMIIDKDRIIGNLESNVQDLHTTIQAKDRQIRELQCREQENSLRLSALTQHLEKLQSKNHAIDECMTALQTYNGELKETIDGLKKRILELEEQDHLDASASKELIAISIGLDTSLSFSNVRLQDIQGDLEKLAAETQVSLIKLTENCDHSVLTSRLAREEKICGPDFSEMHTLSPGNNETQLMDSLQRIWSCILESELSVDELKAYVADEISTNLSDTSLANSGLQKAAHSVSLTLSGANQMCPRKQAKSGISKSVQTEVSLSQVSKMLVNEKRLRDKVSLLENRLKEREVTMQSLEQKLSDFTGRSAWLNLQETRVATPLASYITDIDKNIPSSDYEINNTLSEAIQTDPRLSLEAPDPSWPDFQEKMDLFEATLNNLYLALQQQKAQAGADLKIEDLATTIRTQILEALNGTMSVPALNNDRNLDLSIITDDIIDYDRSLLHLQQKKSEQRPGSRGILPFWK